MLILPCINGLYELHPQIAEESELLMSDNRGRDTLYKYNIRSNRSTNMYQLITNNATSNKNNSNKSIKVSLTISLLYFANYKSEYISSILSSYFEANTLFHLSKYVLPVIDSRIDLVPNDIMNDVLQINLKKLIETQYCIQQLEIKKSFEQRGDFKYIIKQIINQNIKQYHVFK